MPLPWPSFWQHIPTDDRPAISDILTELLAHGALLGETGRSRELYLLAREYQRELGEYLAPLHLEAIPDPDRPILQLRPVPGDCGLVARFNKAETILVLTLWRMYHDARMNAITETVVVTANDIAHQIELYFRPVDATPDAPAARDSKTSTGPTNAQLREMLLRLRNRRLVQLQWNEDSDRFGESQIEILPTLSRVIPFENAAAWEEQAALYRPTPSAGEPSETVPQ